MDSVIDTEQLSQREGRGGEGWGEGIHELYAMPMVEQLVFGSLIQ